jgi:SSS family solute:Na+ symporter
MSFPRLHWVDLSIIIFYLIANALAGFITFRKRRRPSSARTEAEEYILAGRTLTLPAFVATLVSTWYGGIIGVGEYAYDKGIVMWVVFGIPYYFAAIIYALVLAPRVNADRDNATIADRLRNTYGQRAGYIGAVVAFFMTSPAGYIMTLGTLYEWYFGITPWVGILLAIVSSIVYLFNGGFRASVRADMLQFCVMFLGFAIILPYAWSAIGDWSYVTAHVPRSHIDPVGGFSGWYIAVWYIIALSTLVDPNVNTRAYAARSSNTAKWGVLISVGFWLIFDLMTNAAGLYAKAAFTALPESRFAYPALAERVLPLGLKGVFYTGMLATVLSTVDSFFFTSATIVGRDILWRLRGKGDESQVTRYTRLGLFVTAIVSVAVILVSPKIYTIWYAFGSILVPALLFSLSLSYFPKIRPQRIWAEASMIAGGGIALATYVSGCLCGTMEEPSYYLGIEPIYAGLAVSFVLTLIGILRRNVQCDKDRDLRISTS